MFAFFFSTLSLAQNLEFKEYRMTELESGYPSKVSKMVESLPNVKSASLKTGIDSIDIFLGTFGHEKNSVWAYIDYSSGNSFSILSFEKIDASSLLTNNIDFTFDQETSNIEVKVVLDPNVDKVYYQWIDHDQTSPIAKVQKVQRSIEKGMPMPVFSVESLGGGKVSLNDYQGKYLIINWWQTTCAPCIKEMPGLNQMVNKYQDDPNVEFIAIAWDDKEKLTSFLKEREFIYPQALYNEEVASLFGRSFPKHIIVNPEGIVSFYFIGGYAEISNLIEEALVKEMQN